MKKKNDNEIHKIQNRHTMYIQNSGEESTDLFFFFLFVFFRLIIYFEEERLLNKNWNSRSQI